ncbi:MAG TPA: diguanylate cyclase [Candidatus Acidoferrum sp.]|nr:diguanylate cyclase [Candidatus Acidoferrum sp.]
MGPTRISSFETASRVAHRISQRIAEDIEVPRISVSIGVAEYPRDGSTIESLLSAADRALYEIKPHSRATVLFSGTVADEVR